MGNDATRIGLSARRKTGIAQRRKEAMSKSKENICKKEYSKNIKRDSIVVER